MLIKLVFQEVKHCDESSVTFIPDVEAKYVGGDKALFRFFKKTSLIKISTKKPSHTVYVNLLVCESGDFTIIGIVNSEIGEKYVEEAKKLVRSTIGWIPAKKDNKNVASKIIVPVHFK